MATLDEQRQAWLDWQAGLPAEEERQRQLALDAMMAASGLYHTWQPSPPPIEWPEGVAPLERLSGAYTGITPAHEQWLRDLAGMVGTDLLAPAIEDAGFYFDANARYPWDMQYWQEGLENIGRMERPLPAAPGYVADPFSALAESAYTQDLPGWLEPRMRYPTETYTPQTEFLESVNRLMPYMGRKDMPMWGQYLYAAEPTVYPYEQAAGWAPTAEPPSYATPERRETVRQEMFGEGGLIDIDSPVRDWLKAVTGTQEAYGPGGQRVAAPRRTRAQQREYETTMTGLLESPEAYGATQEAASLWSPWLKSFLQPTTDWLQPGITAESPDWLKQSSLYGPRSKISRGGMYANPRWF